MNEVRRQAHEEKLGVHVLLAEPNGQTLFEQPEFAPVFADLRDVVQRVDVADNLCVANKVCGDSPPVCSLAEHVEPARQWRRQLFEIERDREIKQCLVLRRILR